MPRVIDLGSDGFEIDHAMHNTQNNFGIFELKSEFPIELV
jgi:hypothetical protein